MHGCLYGCKRHIFKTEKQKVTSLVVFKQQKHLGVSHSLCHLRQKLCYKRRKEKRKEHEKRKEMKRRKERKATLCNHFRWWGHKIELTPHSSILISCFRPKCPVSFPSLTKKCYAIAKVMSGYYLTLIFCPKWGVGLGTE